ncbi:hypothetical protein LBMAG21_11840 [Armatimonadota bacterium]|nr:hypothetical protein LBMAG21_11840 [Armatimonadota bacterium]
MSHILKQFTATLQQLGTPETITALSTQGYAPSTRPRVNSHLHLPPNFSAFETVAQAVALMEAQGIGVVGVSNYYDFTVYGDFAERVNSAKVFPLFGLEVIALLDNLVTGGVKINDPGNPGKMYLCGKGITQFDPMGDEATELMAVIRANDSARMAVIADRLAEVFRVSGLETGLDADAVKERVVRRHECPLETVYLQERHLAQAFQEVLFEKVEECARLPFLERAFGVASKSTPTCAVTVQNEIRSHLMKAGKPAFAEDTFVGFDHSIRLILALGGIPCYPMLIDGASPLCKFEETPEKVIAEIQARNISCVEFIPIRNSPETLTKYVKAVRAAGLFVTAGTEHNTLDLIPIEPTCVNSVPIPEEIKELFWEGACVIAAHQYLTLSGLAGFVDSSGTPNPTYKTAHERIEAFRNLGAALIAKYREQ